MASISWHNLRVILEVDVINPTMSLNAYGYLYAVITSQLTTYRLLTTEAAVYLIGPISQDILIALLQADGNPYIGSGMAWTSPAANGALIGYESLLSLLAIYHACKHFPQMLRKTPAGSTRSIASVAIRDNLVYFFVALAELIGSVFSSWIFPINTALEYWGIQHILQFVFLTMIGPWMILSLRKYHERDIEGRILDGDHELLTIVFQKGSLSASETGEVC
ncbi:hypothetical protein CONPUDRAFT_147860 [Coniophora puteana RWD-64-598 SS2]|uniref:Uncharacterized protein n=1 Tax=Coniophora puteana (strain RWD-64-598) TaxID=741705 RepID=R7SGT0_CONPW|nr:uncharacterized protein CONPUDRAFT_147860 [Coniophora puteana RWD-64-598 SS2]EIW74249.1 hypothetical protein CONPUDRAFT_147860 [Coniophora puteana RWD-64-598 SS2]